MQARRWFFVAMLGLFASDALAQSNACATRLRVIKIKKNDVLMIREAPSPDDRVIGIIAPDARDIESLCDCRGEWCRVRYFDVVGWVSRHYVERDAQ